MAVYRPTLIGTNGDDTIQNPVQNAIVDGLAGNDSINNSANYAMIFGGKGNDTIYNTGGEASIWGGKGNDVIYNTTQGVRFMFNAGDGFDVIYGANANCEAIYF